METGVRSQRREPQPRSAVFLSRAGSWLRACQKILANSARDRERRIWM